MALKHISNSPALDITDVSRITGLTTHTLRAWEIRYAAVKPGRRGNRRTYSSTDIERLSVLKELVSQGHSIGSIVSLDESALKKLLESSSPEWRENSSPDHRSELLKLVENYDLEGLAAKLRIQRIRRSTESFLLDLVCPLLSDVGRRVEAGKLGIAQEHALSALLREQLARIRDREPGRDRPVIAFCTPEGDYHELGILIGAKLAACKGFPVLYFGPNLPTTALSDILAARRPDILVISATAIASNLRNMDAYLATCTRRAKPSPEIWIAGPLAEELKDRCRPIKSFREFALRLDEIRPSTVPAPL